MLETVDDFNVFRDEQHVVDVDGANNEVRTFLLVEDGVIVLGTSETKIGEFLRKTLVPFTARLLETVKRLLQFPDN